MYCRYLPSGVLLRSVTMLVQLCVVLFAIPALALTPASPEDDDFSQLVGQPSAPVLTILYTATSRGELYPCPTCGETAVGGLPRRATVIKDVKKQPGPVIVISGPDEFLSDTDLLRYRDEKNSEKGPGADYKPEKAKLLLAGYNELHVDAGYMSTLEEYWLIQAAGAVPSNFSVVEKAPVSKILKTTAGNIGVVFFPYGTERFGFPSENQITAVIEAGKQLIGNCSLIIGVSPWGSTAEEKFLPQAKHVYSVLLGGGPGLGFTYSQPETDNSLLWVRSENMGRAVNLIDFFELPHPGGTIGWLEGITFDATQLFLKPEVVSDLEMVKKIGETAK